MTRVLTLEPAPGITIPGVNVPVPGEQEAVDAAVSSGDILAGVLVAILAGVFLRWLWSSMVVRVLLALAGGVTITYIVMKG